MCSSLHIIAKNLYSKSSLFIINLQDFKNRKVKKMVDEDWGYIEIKLESLLKEKNLSKSKFSFLSQMQRSQLNKWLRNEVSYIDLHVLSRICKSLDCNVEDVLEYHDPKVK